MIIDVNELVTWFPKITQTDGFGLLAPPPAWVWRLALFGGLLTLALSLFAWLPLWSGAPRPSWAADLSRLPAPVAFPAVWPFCLRLLPAFLAGRLLWRRSAAPRFGLSPLAWSSLAPPPLFLLAFAFSLPALFAALGFPAPPSFRPRLRLSARART